jgi:hypothetical protein
MDLLLDGQDMPIAGRRATLTSFQSRQTLTWKLTHFTQRRARLSDPVPVQRRGLRNLISGGATLRSKRQVGRPFRYKKRPE